MIEMNEARLLKFKESMKAMIPLIDELTTEGLGLELQSTIKLILDHAYMQQRLQDAFYKQEH